ncbi:MAG TPA: amidohydrolase family protein [Thermomicrobiales bacterium]|nr:amidohydrolase family protein [Thermomicrobiales bacterium]
MATTAPATQPAMPQSDAAGLRAIDVDLHHQFASWGEVAPYAPESLHHRIARQSGPPLARHGFRPIGAPFDETLRPPAKDGCPVHPASDPAWVKDRYLAARGIDVAILTGSLTSLGVQPNADMAAAIARSINDWTLATWVRPFDCFKGSILVAPQDPVQAVAEIDRLGDDPGMVQVLMGSATETPLGRRNYHPIYEACVRHQLPLALHLGGEGAGLAPPPTAVGHPTTYFEWYGSLPQVYMAHIMSMVTEGVFERFPALTVVLYEGGIAWLPHIMWRFDKNWKAQRSETPWVKQRPSAYIVKHFRSTTYPLELMREPDQLAQVLAMMDGEHTLLFSGNYPNWALGDPQTMLEGIPEHIRRNVLVENALATYGERLNQPHR